MNSSPGPNPGLIPHTQSKTGTVTGIDYQASNTEQSKEYVQECCSRFDMSGKVAPRGAVGTAFVTGNGWHGWARNGPYDLVHIEAFVSEASLFKGTQLLAQLKTGGGIVVVLGRNCGKQDLVVLRKQADGTLAAPEVIQRGRCFTCELMPP